MERQDQFDVVLNDYASGNQDVEAANLLSSKIQGLVNTIEFPTDEDEQATFFKDLNSLVGRINGYHKKAKSKEVKQELDHLIHTISLKAAPILTLPLEIFNQVVSYTTPQESEVSKFMQDISYKNSIQTLQWYFNQEDSSIFPEIQRFAEIDADMSPKEKYQKLWSLLLKKFDCVLNLNHIHDPSLRGIHRFFFRLLPNSDFAVRIPFLPRFTQFIQENHTSLLDEKSYYLLHNMFEEEIKYQFSGAPEIEDQIDSAGYLVKDILPEDARDLNELIVPLIQMKMVLKRDNEIWNQCIRYFFRGFDVSKRVDFFKTSVKCATKGLKDKPNGTYLLRKGSRSSSISISYAREGKKPAHHRIQYSKDDDQFVLHTSRKTFMSNSIEDIITRFKENGMITTPASKSEIKEDVEISSKEAAFKQLKKVMGIDQRDDFFVGEVGDLEIMIKQAEPYSYLITKDRDDFLVIFKDGLHNVLSSHFSITNDFKLIGLFLPMTDVNEELEKISLYFNTGVLTPIKPVEQRADYFDGTLEEIVSALNGSHKGTYVITKSSYPYSYKFVFMKGENVISQARMAYHMKSGQFVVDKCKYSSFDDVFRALKEALENLYDCDFIPFQ